MAEPTSKAALRENFVQHISKLVDFQNQRHESALNQGPSTFYEPPDSDWDGDLFDLQGMSKAFDRTPQQEDFQTAASEGGVQGDYILTILQGDMLAVLERAYRARHHTSVRSRLHAAARQRGHGFPTGVLSQGLQGYLEWLEKQAKEQRTTSGE